ncbi:MAG: NTP transferase domain-containing protein [Planctomycetes bacterium]|nr:NTP transferase domain-containing protein [Planctomycetota bacterium]
MKPETKAIVLAAGKGTRMKSDKPKVLHELCGHTILSYALRMLLEETDIHEVTVVVGFGGEAVRKEFDGWPLEWVTQEEQLGTGHAVQTACHRFEEGFTGDVIIMAGDVPMLDANTIEEIADELTDDVACVVLTAHFENPAEYGRIVRENGTHNIMKIVEAKDASSDELMITEINSGVYALNYPLLKEALGSLSANNAAGEIYFTDVVEYIQKKGKKVKAHVVEDQIEIMGINDRAQLAEMNAIIKNKVLQHWMSEGVTIVDPSTTYIEIGAVIGRDTVVHPFTVIRADVVIGEHCEVGPFTHVRPGTVLENTAELGNFVEAKKAHLHPHVKAKHLTYLGDVVIGEKTNIGAGTVICNYDGVHKHQTNIGSNVFIGSGSMIVAPRNIGDGASTGAGSVVTKDVDPGAVVYGVPAKRKG